MLLNSVSFSAHEDIVAQKDLHPQPIKLNLPSWYKKIKHSAVNKTIKGCVPFLQTLTTGYLLKIPAEFYLRHNVFNEGKRVTHKITTSKSFSDQIAYYLKLNINFNDQIHPSKQILGSPLVQKNKTLPVQKILNPWFIKTPPGFSCLFVPPLNNTDDRFSIISGIVDTDSFDQRINFPYIVNGDKYPYIDEIIKAGVPYVQVIPFKRQNWQMKIKSMKEKEIIQTRRKMTITEKMIHTYRNTFFKKTLWK